MRPARWVPQTLTIHSLIQGLIDFADTTFDDQFENLIGPYAASWHADTNGAKSDRLIE